MFSSTTNEIMQSECVCLNRYTQNIVFNFQEQKKYLFNNNTKITTTKHISYHDKTFCSLTKINFINKTKFTIFVCFVYLVSSSGCHVNIKRNAQFNIIQELNIKIKEQVKNLSIRFKICNVYAS